MAYRRWSGWNQPEGGNKVKRYFATPEELQAMGVDTSIPKLSPKQLKRIKMKISPETWEWKFNQQHKSTKYRKT